MSTTNQKFQATLAQGFMPRRITRASYQSTWLYSFAFKGSLNAAIERTVEPEKREVLEYGPDPKSPAVISKTAPQ